MTESRYLDPEDEAFNEIERQAKQRQEAVKAAMLRAKEDDDIQDYIKPWVGLTEDEIAECFKVTPDLYLTWHIYKRIEAKLKEKNI